GPGTPQADIYSLGKVLYEISMGRDRQEFPKLPADLLVAASRESAAGPVPPQAGSGLKSAALSRDAATALLELNAVILKACHHDPRQRYQSAKRMAGDLEMLQRGRSVRHKRTIQRRLATVTKLGLGTALIGLIAAGGFLLSRVVKGHQPAGIGVTPPLEMKGTKNREAWNAYIQGRHYLNRLSSDGLKQAIAFMQEAIRLDPDFALAYAELAEIYGWSGDQLFPNREAYIKMREAALKALQMDDSLAQAHKTLGYVVANV